MTIDTNAIRERLAVVDQLPPLGFQPNAYGEQFVDAVRLVLTHAPTDIRALLGALDGAQARIATLETALDTTHEALDIIRRAQHDGGNRR